MSKIKKLYFLSFLFTLHIAISAYVNSSFLMKIISEKYVGMMYTISSILTLLLLSKSSSLLKNFGNRRMTITLLFVNMISLVGLITSTSSYITGISFILFSTTNTLVLFCIDIFIEHFSDPTKTGKTRGSYLTIISIAWMLSPIITSLLVQDKNYKLIYLISFIMAAVMTIGLIFSVKKFKDKTYIKESFFETFKYLKTNSHIFAVIAINFVLQFFYALMVVYTPIYLHEHLGFGWDKIGIIFTIMLSPFVILSLPIGVLIDKYHIRKRLLLTIGFMIMAISTIFITFTNSLDLIIWATILFSTRVGASIIETTSEIYFFSHISDEDAYLLGIFRDMTPFAYITAPIVATIIFIFLPFKYIFIILGIIIIISGIYYIPRLKRNNVLQLPNQNK